MYGAVLAYALATERERTAAPATAALGGLGALLLLLVLRRADTDLLPWPLGLLGVGYAVAVAVRGSGVDEGAPFVAAGLLLCGELAAWSMDERFRIRADRGIVMARAVGVGALVFAGLAVAALVVGLSATSAGGGLAWTILGSVAAVGVVALGVAVARRAET